MARGKWEKERDEVRVRTGLMGKVAEFLRSKRARELALTSAAIMDAERRLLRRRF